ncbi:MAG: hypothetical protein II712_04470 [Erysipelotrichaceae bacterium]|nr:hypothetical protein [Erysipelotrichaceae bacterium]
MKRKVLFPALLMILLFSAFSIRAQDHFSVEIVEKVKPGEEFTVNIVIGEYEFSNGAVKIELPDSLEITETQWILSEASLMAFDSEKNNGAFLYSDNIIYSGKIFTFKLRALEKDENAYVRIRLILRKAGGQQLFDSTLTRQVSIGSTGAASTLKTAGISALLLLITALVIMIITRRKR